MSTFLGGLWASKRNTWSIPLRTEKSLRNKQERDTWCAAKVNLAFGFILKNIEDGRFRYFYAHENNTLLDRSKLVKTKDNLAKLKDILNKNELLEGVLEKEWTPNWVLQVNKRDRRCCYPQRGSYGLRKRSFIQTSIEK